MKKYTYLFGLVEAINCNPNWNPDDDNMPRLSMFNWDERLEISPYSVKRKMRNAWSDLWLNVILDRSTRSKTIKAAYANAFKDYAWIKLSSDSSEISWLENLSDDILTKYIDIVFGIYNDWKVKWLPEELFEKIKKEQLVVSNAFSINTVWHKSSTFRKWLTSNFTSDDKKSDGAGGMWNYNSVDYALFPIVLSSQSEYNEEIRTNLLKGFVDWFNHNMTATKNFNVFSGLVITSEVPLKKNFINANNPSNDGYKWLDLVVSNLAKGIKVSGKEFTSNGTYQELNNADLFEVLSKYVEAFNNQ